MSVSGNHDQRATDAAVIELLRVDSALEIGDLAEALGVTATAIRQRLDRLMRSGLVERTTVSRPRGRPAHAYSLTAEGRRCGGDNFRDLAMVLWKEVRRVREPAVRQGLLSRIGSAMAAIYRPEVTGTTAAERLRSLADVMRRRNVSCGVEQAPGSDGGLAVLTSYSCPYPDLAEQDRSICAAERLMLQDLVGSSVALSECRLDGGTCCRFTAGAGAEGDDGAAVGEPTAGA
jgi:DeoR family suf operon transcriptional repressor